jgi:hypothetical protein
VSLFKRRSSHSNNIPSPNPKEKERKLNSPPCAKNPPPPTIIATAAKFKLPLGIQPPFPPQRSASAQWEAAWPKVTYQTAVFHPDQTFADFPLALAALRAANE